MNPGMDLESLGRSDLRHLPLARRLGHLLFQTDLERLVAERAARPRRYAPCPYANNPLCLPARRPDALAALRGVVLKAGCQSSDDELLKHAFERNFTKPDQRVSYHQSGTIAIAFGIVEIGDAG